MAYALAARIPSGQTEAVRRLFAESLGPRGGGREAGTNSVGTPQARPPRATRVSTWG